MSPLTIKVIIKKRIDGPFLAFMDNFAKANGNYCLVFYRQSGGITAISGNRDVQNPAPQGEVIIPDNEIGWTSATISQSVVELVKTNGQVLVKDVVQLGDIEGVLVAEVNLNGPLFIFMAILVAVYGGHIHGPGRCIWKIKPNAYKSSGESITFSPYTGHVTVPQVFHLRNLTDGYSELEFPTCDNMLDYLSESFRQEGPQVLLPTARTLAGLLQTPVNVRDKSSFVQESISYPV